MGLLDGDLQRMFGAAFGSLLLEGRHYHNTQTRSANGDVGATVTKVQPFKGYRETTVTARRGDEGSASTMRMLVLQSYEGKPLDPIEPGDVLALDGVRMVVGQPVVEDAAHTHWVAEGAPE